MLVVLVAGILVYLLPVPPGLGADGNVGLAVLVFAGGLWILEPIPLQVTGLIIPVSLVATGILGVEAAFEPFAYPVVFLILGSLFLAESLRKHGLTRRVALDMIVRCKGRPRLLLLALMGVAGITSMWVFSTAVVAMLIPVCLSIATHVEAEKRDRFVTVLLMALVLSSTLGALSTILGASSNAVASGILGQDLEWSFLDWMKYGTPLAMLFVPLSWTILVLTVYPSIDPIDSDAMAEELQEHGRLSGPERGIVVILLLAIVSWVLGPPVASWLGVPADMADSAVISLVAATLLFTANIINWQDARQVNWGVYLIIGAGLSLGKGLHASGVSTWLAGLIADVSMGYSFFVITAITVFFSAALSNAVNNTTVVAILAPVMADTAATMGLTQPELMLPMAFGATFGFLLPASSSRMALIYASGEISPREMLRIGSIATVPLLLMTVLYFYLLFRVGLI